MRSLRYSRPIGIMFVALFLAAFLSCEKTPISSTAEDDTSVWTLSGLVYDAYSTKADTSGIAEVTVRTVNEGNMVETATNGVGMYTVQGLTAGEHKFIFLKEGYATYFIEGVRNGLDSSTGKLLDVDRNIGMYPLTGSLSGKLYVLKKDSVRVPAAGCTVRVYIGSTYLPRYRYAAVDSDGNFSIQGLPLKTVTVQFLDFMIDGNAYYSTSAVSVDLSIRNKLGARDLILRTDFGIKVLETNFASRIFESETLKVVFADAVDTNTVIISLGGTNNRRHFWSSDLKTVYVIPEFRLTKNNTYTLSVSGLTSDKKAFSWSGSVVTGRQNSIYLISANVLDNELKGLQNIPRDMVIKVTLSDSVASVVTTHGSYDDYRASLDSTGRVVTITRNSAFSPGQTYTVYVFGIRQNGQTFSVQVPTFRVAEFQEVTIKSSDFTDALGSALQGVPIRTTYTVVLSESVATIVEHHSSYPEYRFTLASDGKTVTVTRNDPFYPGEQDNFNIYGSTIEGYSFALSIPSFRALENGTIYIVKGNAIDSTARTGLRDLSPSLVVTVVLSDSVKEITNHSSSYNMSLASDGKTVIIRRVGSAWSSSNNFTIYGVKGDGENFSVSHPTFYMATSVRLLWTNVKTGNYENVTNFGVTDTLKFLFSQKIDTTKDIDITWSRYGGQHEVAFAGDTLLVIPLQALVDPGNLIGIYFSSLHTEQGETFSSGTHWFNVVESIIIEYTNVEGPDGGTLYRFGLSDSIVIHFSQSVDVDQLTGEPFKNGVATLIYIYAGTSSSNKVDATYTWSNNNKWLTIKPISSLLPRYQQSNGYRLFVDQDLPSIHAGDKLGSNKTFTFYTILGLNVPRKVEGFEPDTFRALITYLPAAGDLTGSGFNVRWREMDSVDTYYIYALGSVRNTSHWIQIKSVASAYSTGAIFGTANITRTNVARFDLDGDALIQNNHIRLIVVAENLAGRGTAHSDTIELNDNVAVGDTISGTSVNTLTSVLYSGGSFNNATTLPVVRMITITFPEWMDVTAGTPAISWSETGGDAGAAPTSNASSWDWLTRTTGRFNVTVPASTDWSSDTPTIDISGMKDSSGNTCQDNTYTEGVQPTNGGGGGALTP